MNIVQVQVHYTFPLQVVKIGHFLRWVFDCSWICCQCWLPYLLLHCMSHAKICQYELTSLITVQHILRLYVSMNQFQNVHLQSTCLQLPLKLFVSNIPLQKEIMRLAWHLAQFHVKFYAIVKTVQVKALFKDYFRTNFQHWAYLVNSILSNGSLDLDIFRPWGLKIYQKIIFIWLNLLYFGLKVNPFDCKFFTLHLANSHSTEPAHSYLIGFNLSIILISIAVEV